MLNTINYIHHVRFENIRQHESNVIFSDKRIVFFHYANIVTVVACRF